ncbi:MAG: adenylosuccinate synthetase [Clostridiales bacterium]|nr:adenylosuccinate synthetase [Clostridiales bacterium]
MSVYVIIGRNFGDEGKGLATDCFAAMSSRKGRSCIVIRHNGGAQAGHTVDLRDKRFIFHQISSGSFRGADTYWSDTFMPDLYKLSEEYDGFSRMYGSSPAIFSSPDACPVLIDDVLINQMLETNRGDNRHGSCGMGIDEAARRIRTGTFALTVKDIKHMSPDGIYHELRRIRNEYTRMRLSELGIDQSMPGEYLELLNDGNVLRNYADMMNVGSELIDLKDPVITDGYDVKIFEGAQGLLLDQNNIRFAPHLTTSNTGLTNPSAFIDEYLSDNDVEVIYVARTYVTRHGNGPLPFEGELDLKAEDETNVFNEWQGSIRYAPYGGIEDLKLPVSGYKDSLMITHLNETEGRLLTVNGSLSMDTVRQEIAPYDLYLSRSRFSDQIENVTGDLSL